MQKEESSVGRLLSLFFYFGNAWLTIYLFGLFIQKNPVEEVVGIFRKIRTYFYLVYLLLLFLLGLKMVLSRKKPASGKITNPGWVEEWVVSIAINLVLTTLAYSIAKISYDVLSRVGTF